MIFSPATRQDIMKYFQGTYVKFREEGDKLFLIEQIEAYRILGKCENGEQFCLYMNNETPYEMEYILPHKSYFQFGPNAVLLTRVPAQQYFRGLCASNTNLSYMGPGGVKAMQLDFEALKHYVNKQKTFTVGSAIGASECATCVLTSRMMLNRGNKQIYIDFTPVAKVQPSRSAITMLKPIFFDEVQDMLKSTESDKIWKLERDVPPPVPKKVTNKDMLKDMGYYATMENEE